MIPLSSPTPVAPRPSATTSAIALAIGGIPSGSEVALYFLALLTLAFALAFPHSIDMSGSSCILKFCILLGSVVVGDNLSSQPHHCTSRGAGPSAP